MFWKTSPAKEKRKQDHGNYRPESGLVMKHSPVGPKSRRRSGNRQPQQVQSHPQMEFGF